MWILKSEPDAYSLDDLKADKKTVWDGVTNNAALVHIRNVRKGDEAVIYHTGKERAAVGLGVVTSDPYPDPKQDDEKLAVFDIKYKKRFDRPVPLADIKAEPSFSDWALVKQARLSVVPATKAQWTKLLKMAGE
jgi:predicted RNA-binding protein with PUA-like domain